MKVGKRVQKWLCGALGALLLGSAAAVWLGAECRCAAVRSESVPAAVVGAQPQAARAVAMVRYTEQNPATVKPVLRWSKVPGAVAYELEVLGEAPEDDTRPAGKALFSTKQIYVNGYNADLSAYAKRPYLYWRVRGLDIEGKPIGSFSAPEKICVDRERTVVQSPVPTSHFRKTRGAALLYPVYAWIPVHGADHYEVEILDAPPENPNGIEPSRHRIDAALATGFDYYDEVARISEKTLYWRVRGLDKDGGPVGVYSEAEAFNIDLKQHALVATYGDSITHGGGDISYSPADWEYSYQKYLEFPTINLARSGDTSETMVERFERDVVPFHPRYLLILAGSNSLRAAETAESVIDDLKALRAKCLAHEIRPVFLTIPPVHPGNIARAFDQSTASDWKKKVARVNRYVRRQSHIEVARALADETGLLPERFGIDGLHMGPEGKRRMAEAVNTQWKCVF